MLGASVTSYAGSAGHGTGITFRRPHTGPNAMRDKAVVQASPACARSLSTAGTRLITALHASRPRTRSQNPGPLAVCFKPLASYRSC
jgi:hypothetical protein